MPPKTLDNESAQVFVIINFCKYGKYISETTIGDPHFLPV